MHYRLLTLAALMFLINVRAMACQLCASSLQLTISAEELIYAEHSVLAMPVSNEFRVVAVIKGERPPGGVITGEVFRAVMNTEKPLLLIRDDDWLRWVNFGPVSAEQAGWLRKLSTGKRSLDLTDAEWCEHVAYFLPYLENSEPMVAEIAFNEFLSAPYSALRTLKPRLDAATIRKWLTDPKLANRQTVYLLLLGIAGTPQDAIWLQRRILVARREHDATNLPAMLSALIQLRGKSGVEDVQTLYLTDQTRTKPEIEAAELALKVTGS